MRRLVTSDELNYYIVHREGCETIIDFVPPKHLVPASLSDSRLAGCQRPVTPFLPVGSLVEGRFATRSQVYE